MWTCENESLCLVPSAGGRHSSAGVCYSQSKVAAASSVSVTPFSVATLSSPQLDCCFRRLPSCQGKHLKKPHSSRAAGAKHAARSRFPTYSKRNVYGFIFNKLLPRDHTPAETRRNEEPPPQPQVEVEDGKPQDRPSLRSASDCPTGSVFRTDRKCLQNGQEVSSERTGSVPHPITRLTLTVGGRDQTENVSGR